jgi:protein arginine kinase activator
MCGASPLYCYQQSLNCDCEFDSRGWAMKKCPRCGVSLISLELTHRVGCAFCYQYFHRELESLLRETDPQGTPWDISVEPKEILLQNLQQAVANEEYEEAAKIRDKMNAAGQDVDPSSY